MEDLFKKYANAHTCDNWVVLFLNSDDPHYRVLVGTSGGYLSGDSWRINSGVVKVEEGEKHFAFIGSSGSVYLCHKDANGLRVNTAGIYAQLQEKFGDKVSMMPEDTDWINHDWIIT